MKRTIFFLLYYFVFGIIVLGFFFHNSGEKQILCYSYAYLIGLIVISILLLVVIPWLLKKFISKNGLKALVYSLIPTLFLLGIVYLIFHFKYDTSQYNNFDPFLQIHKTEINFKDYNEEDYVILCLGGSSTYNNYLPEESRYTSVIEKLLRKKYPHKNIKVINAGMDWYTTKHSLINYSTYYKKVKPDLVTVMHAINDLYRSFSPPQYALGEFQPDYSHFYGPSIHGANPPTYEKFLFQIINSYWFSTLSKNRTEINYPLSKYQSISTFRDQLTLLVKEIKQDSSECVIIEQPYIYKPNLSVNEENILRFGYEFCTDGKEFASYLSLQKALDTFNLSAKHIAEELNCTFVPTQIHMPKTTDFFKDDVHYTAVGSEKMGELIAAEIIASEIIR